MESIVKNIISEYYSYLSQCERDSTETEKSITILKRISYKLQAQSELAEEYFNMQMGERERVFRLASEVLDKAIKLGDAEYAEIATRIIGVVHNKSPFSF